MADESCTVLSTAVHQIKLMNRQGGKMVVMTKCGQELALAVPEGALVQAGVSCWASDVTCGDCR
jgi:hypothetical protein